MELSNIKEHLTPLQRLILENENLEVTVSHLSEDERWEEADKLVEQYEETGYTLKEDNKSSLYELYKLFLLLFYYPEDSSSDKYVEFISYYLSEHEWLFNLNNLGLWEIRNGRIYYAGVYWDYVGEWRKPIYQAEFDRLAQKD